MHSVIAAQMMAEKWNAAKGVNCQFEKNKKQCDKSVCPAHKKLRDGAKAVNFGVAYGKEVYALAEDLKVPVETASEILAAWRKSNPKVVKFLTGAETLRSRITTAERCLAAFDTSLCLIGRSLNSGLGKTLRSMDRKFSPEGYRQEVRIDAWINGEGREEHPYPGDERRHHEDHHGLGVR
jgi:hypothetical protein